MTLYTIIDCFTITITITIIIATVQNTTTVKVVNRTLPANSDKPVMR